MRIFVLGTGASGALLAQLLARQGHRVTCGDKDLERAKRFLGRKSTLQGVFSPGALPASTRQAILDRARHRFGIAMRTARLKDHQEDEDL